MPKLKHQTDLCSKHTGITGKLQKEKSKKRIKHKNVLGPEIKMPFYNSGWGAMSLVSLGALVIKCDHILGFR